MSSCHRYRGVEDAMLNRQSGTPTGVAGAVDARPTAATALQIARSPGWEIGPRDMAKVGALYKAAVLASAHVGYFRSIALSGVLTAHDTILHVHSFTYIHAQRILTSKASTRQL